jgi:hypothetical protein
MGSFNSGVAANDLFCRHGVAPVNFRKWRVKCIGGWKKALARGSDSNQYKEEIDELEKIIGDQSLVINELKKYRHMVDRVMMFSNLKDILLTGRISAISEYLHPLSITDPKWGG